MSSDIQDTIQRNWLPRNWNGNKSNGAIHLWNLSEGQIMKKQPESVARGKQLIWPSRICTEYIGVHIIYAQCISDMHKPIPAFIGVYPNASWPIGAVFRAYVHVCMYCLYWPRQALMPSRPQKTLPWSGTRWAPLRAPWGSCPTTLFRHRGPTPGPVLAHQRAQHPSGGPKACRLRRQWAFITHLALGEPAQSPVRDDLGR